MVEGLLVILSIGLMPFAIVSFLLLLNEARKPPRFGALTERAFIGAAITLMVVSGVTVTINRVSGYSLLPIDAARLLFLASLVMLEFVPVIWLVLLVTHRLGDGGEG